MKKRIYLIALFALCAYSLYADGAGWDSGQHYDQRCVWTICGKIGKKYTL